MRWRYSYYSELLGQEVSGLWNRDGCVSIDDPDTDTLDPFVVDSLYEEANEYTDEAMASAIASEADRRHDARYDDIIEDE